MNILDCLLEMISDQKQQKVQNYKDGIIKKKYGKEFATILVS